MKWLQVKLEDVCKCYQPKTISTKQMVDNGKYLVYGANGIIGRFNNYNHEESQVLLTCRGATCGTVNVSKPFSWINGNAMVLQPYDQNLLNQYFLSYYFMLHGKDKSLITGTAQPQIVQNKLNKFPILIPPLAEQQRIVAKIDALFSELDKGVEMLQTIRQQLKTYRQAVLKWAFEGKDNFIPLGEITDMRLGKMLDKKKNKGNLEKYLRNINVRWFSFDLNDLLEMKFENNEYEKYTIKKGDLVICEGGEPGRCAIWKSDNSIKYQKALHRVRPKNGYHSEYLMYYIKHITNKGIIEKYFTGTGIKHLTGESLKKIPIPTCSIEEQTAIVEAIESRLSVCDKLEQLINENLSKAAALRQSILKKAFAGKLVPQDPNDEPAEVLLERIKKMKKS